MLETMVVPNSWMLLNNLAWTFMLAIWSKDDYFNTAIKLVIALIATTGWALML